MLHLVDPKAMIRAAASHLARHPEELLRAVRNLRAGRMGVPLAALRWVADHLESESAPKDVEVEAQPPGLRLSATVPAMGNVIRANATVFVEEVVMNAETVRVKVRFEDVALKILVEAAGSPVVTLIKSGALDLSKPGNVVQYLPNRPEYIVEAKDDFVVLDFRKLPQLEKDERVARVVDVVLEWFRITGVRCDWEHLDVEVQMLPGGLVAAVAAIGDLL